MRRKYDTAVFERAHLSNGIPLFLQRSPILPDERYKISALLPNVGSCADPPEAPGTMHFFEHLPFQGTVRYPSHEAIHQPVLSEGGTLNAGTSITLSHYYVTGARRRLVADVAILGELVTAPLLDEPRVVHERQVIAQEFREVSSRPKRILDYHFRRWFYGQHPYGHPTIGELATIEAMTAEALRVVHRRFYHAGNLALVCTGDLLPDADLLDVLERTFGTLRPERPFEVPAPTLPADRHDEVVDPKLGDDHLFVLYPMPKPTRRNKLAWAALADCLGGSQQAPLSRELRQERGLIYRTGGLAKYVVNAHGAIFEFQFRAHRRNFEEILRVFPAVLAELTADDWAKIKETWQKKRSLCFLHPIDAEDYAITAALRGEETMSFHEFEVLQDTLTWEDLDACRRQLLETKPFIFRALA